MHSQGSEPESELLKVVGDNNERAPLPSQVAVALAPDDLMTPPSRQPESKPDLPFKNVEDALSHVSNPIQMLHKISTSMPSLGHDKLKQAMVAHTGQQKKGHAADAKIPKEDRLLYVGIFSKTDDFDRRNSLRDAWVSALRKTYSDSAKVLVEFIVGRKGLKEKKIAGQSLTEDHKQSQLDVSLKEELQTYRDLFHVPYEELPVKVLMFFAHAVEMRYRFVMKIDIDQELLFRPLIPSLKAESLSTLLYAGQSLKDVSFKEAKATKAKERKMEKYFAGPCYLTSWSLAQRISKAHLDHSIMLWSYSTEGADADYMDMGQWVAYEDQLSEKLVREKQRNAEEDATQVDQVDYRIMDICRPLLPAPEESMETMSQTSVEASKQSDTETSNQADTESVKQTDVLLEAPESSVA